MRRAVLTTVVAVFLFLSTQGLAVERIVILPFESLAKEDISFIQGVIPKLLSSRLSEISGLDTVSAEVTSADEARKKYGPTYLVTGAVTKLGATYSLDIILSNPAGEKVGGYFSSAQDENGILSSLEGLAKDVARSIPGAKPPEDDAALTDIEVETAGVKEEPAGTPPPPEEEKSAEKDLAALQPKGPTGDKGNYTQIKKIKNLGGLPGEIYRVAAADVNGDGLYEFAFMGRHTIYLYRFKDSEMFPTLSFEKGKDHHFLHLDVFDVDGDGLMDFVVTDMVAPFLNSFVVGQTGGKLKIKMDDINWYLSVFEDYRGKRRLIGQATGNELPYSESAYVMEWDGKKLRKGEKIPVPRNEELEMGIINMNAFSDGGKQRFILLDQYEKLRIADEEGDIFWKSGEYYSGATDYFESTEIDPEMIEKVRFYIKGRMKRVAHNDKILFLLREAPRPMIGIIRSFSWSRIVLLEWDGGDFVKKVEGEKANKVITDFAVIESGDGRTLIVSPVVVSQGNIARKGKTNVVLFELVRGEVTN